MDAAASPFVHNGVQLDAACVVDRVLCELLPQGTMAERLTGGNYTAIIPDGMAKALNLGNRQACHAFESEFKSITGVARVVTSLDVAATAEDLCPAGPYPEIPKKGSTVTFDDVRLPKNWNVQFVDTDDFFQLSRPDITVGAEITHDSVKGNYVAHEFQETFVGYGKDGCHPSWNLNFMNLCYNGVRVGCVEPEAGVC